MLRSIGAAIAGYLVIAASVFGGLTLAYVAMGANRAFEPGAYEVSLVWIVTSFAVSLAAAVLGGWVARSVARSIRGPWILAGVVVVLGLALALPVLLGDPGAVGSRPDTVGAMEAMMAARTPAWVQLLNPFVGLLGVLLGGGALAGSKSSPPPAIEPAL